MLELNANNMLGRRTQECRERGQVSRWKGKPLRPGSAVLPKCTQLHHDIEVGNWAFRIVGKHFSLSGIPRAQLPCAFGLLAVML